MANENYSLVPHWSQSLQAEPAGLCLAREKGWLLAWDHGQWIYLLNPQGQVQSQVRFSGPIAQCTFADDGSALAVAGKQGELRWLSLDLTARWERKLNHPLVAMALDPFGHFLAASDSRGIVHFFDHQGKKLGQVESPRALIHLAFIHSRALVAGCADFGLVGAFDMSGNWSWRDGLVVNVGSLAVQGEGSLLLACYSEGLHRYGADGKSQGRVATPEPCRLVAQSFAGDQLVVGGLTKNIFLLDRAGQVLGRHSLEKQVAAIAMGPLAEAIYAAQAGGSVMRLRVKGQ